MGSRRTTAESRGVRGVKTLLKVHAPVLGEGRSVHGFFEQGAIVDIVSKELIHFSDRDAAFIPAQEVELVADFDHAFAFNGEVKSAAPAIEEAREDVIPHKLGGQLVARNARLADNNDGTTDLEPVSDVEIGFEETFGGEILSKHSPGQISGAKFLLPELIVLRRVGVDGFERASVYGEIRLTVPVEVQGAKLDWTGDGLLEDPCLEGAHAIRGQAG